MRHTRNFRQPFDSRCDFVYLKSARVDGRAVEAGDLVDKSALDPRRLRQLYEVRTIAYAPGQVPGKPPARLLAVGPTDLLHPGETHSPAEKRARGVPRARSIRAA